MALKNKKDISTELKFGVSQTDRQIMLDFLDSAQLLTPGENTLPTSDPGTAGSLFITGSDGMNLGNITGSGFAILCVSQG